MVPPIILKSISPLPFLLTIFWPNKGHSYRMTLLGSVFRDTVAAALLFGGAIWVGLLTPQIPLLSLLPLAGLFGFCWILSSYRGFAALAVGLILAFNMGLLVLSVQQDVLTQDVIYALSQGGGLSFLTLWIGFRKETNWFAKTPLPSA